jgi:hypothetical protein
MLLVEDLNDIFHELKGTLGIALLFPFNICNNAVNLRCLGLDPLFLQQAPHQSTARVLSQDKCPVSADLFWPDRLIGFEIFQNPVHVNAGLVPEGIIADD